MYAAGSYLSFNTTTKPMYNPFTISEDEKYTVAKVARERLLIESSFKDHNLRRLVGHANLVDRFLAEYQPPEQPKYTVTHVERIEKKPCREFNHISAYVMQASSQDGDRGNNERDLSSLSASGRKSEQCGVPRSESRSVQITIDYVPVEVDEIKVFADDDDGD
jgi:hypothetical protein